MYEHVCIRICASARMYAEVGCRVRVYACVHTCPCALSYGCVACLTSVPSYRHDRQPLTVVVATDVIHRERCRMPLLPSPAAIRARVPLRRSGWGGELREFTPLHVSVRAIHRSHRLSVYLSICLSLNPMSVSHPCHTPGREYAR